MTAIGEARDARPRAASAVDVPPSMPIPGAVAHSRVADRQAGRPNDAPIFVRLGDGPCEDAIDPELRARFGEFIDLAELDAATRRAKLLELLGGKPIDFDFEDALESSKRRPRA